MIGVEGSTQATKTSVHKQVSDSKLSTISGALGQNGGQINRTEIQRLELPIYGDEDLMG